MKDSQGDKYEREEKQQAGAEVDRASEGRKIRSFTSGRCKPAALAEISLRSCTSYPGVGSCNTERPSFLGPISVNWRCPRGQENGEKVSYSLTYTPTMKLLCVSLQWWIQVIRSL